ncbi:hypothetical protein SLA2020_381230 [Shorea laevis]
MPHDLYLKTVVPIGALYALSLCVYNSAYIFLSVSFVQMLKALTLVAVYSIAVIFKKEYSFKTGIMVNMLSTSLGVAVLAYGELKFHTWGVFLQLLGQIFAILLNSKGIKLNPILSLYYIAPCCFVFLLLPWMILEYPLLREASSFRPDFVIFGSNALCAFGLNLAMFLVVGKTSALTLNVAALTLNVAGGVKDWLLIAFSWSVIKGTVTPVNLVGYLVAFLGVVYYNHYKLKGLKAAEAQKKELQADLEAGRLLQETDQYEGTGKKSETQD